MAQSPFSLAGKVAFVTGGNSGLGRAVALAMREAAVGAGDEGDPAFQRKRLGRHRAIKRKRRS